MESTSRFRLASVPVVAALIAGGSLLVAHDSPVHAQGPTQRYVDPRPAAESVNFTIAQQLAQQRAHQEAAHTPWRKLSWSKRIDRITELGKRTLRAMTAAVTAASEPGTASFEGNLTIVSAPPGQAVGLQRQGDCSLRLLTGTYTVSLTSPTIEVLTETPNYERTLHDLAGLTTTPGTFAQGCDDATAGIGSRRAVYLGLSPQDLYLFAASGHNSSANSNVLYSGTVDTGDADHSVVRFRRCGAGHRRRGARATSTTTVSRTWSASTFSIPHRSVSGWPRRTAPCRVPRTTRCPAPVIGPMPP